MLINSALDGLLICPLTQASLSWSTRDELSNIKKTDERVATHCAKWQQDPRLTGLLKTAEGIYYPVIDEIACLLPEHALVTEPGSVANLTSQDDKVKADVQAFYNEIGWQADGEIYQDAKDSEDLRPVAEDYIQACHQRVKQHLPGQGKYLLDIASGPVQYPIYLSYSESYEYRICADISLTALKEAKKKLGDKGCYLLCDITRLPIKENSMDAVVSLHTLYHVPANQQTKGFHELHRVLKSGGRSVIVYSWGNRSILMNLTMFPFKLASAIRRKLFCQKQNIYFYTHSYAWFVQEIQARYSTQLYAWRSVTVPFLKLFIHQNIGGRRILKALLKLEESFPVLMGRIGAYPLFVSTKK